MPERPSAPLFAWWGSKRLQAPAISAAVNRLAPTLGTGGGVYWEPFVGAGSVALAVAAPRAELSDANPDVIAAHVAVRDRPGDLLDCLRRHETGHSRDHFEACRQRPDDTAEIAAWLMYMTYCSFASRYQVNADGRWVSVWHTGMDAGTRAPWKVTPKLCDRLWAAHRVFRQAAIICRDWSEITPAAGDVVYLDPPYDSTYAPYRQGGSGSAFGTGAQTALHDAAGAWRDQGAVVAVSSNDTPLIRGLYSADRGWETQSLPARRRVSSGHGITAGHAPSGFAGSDLLMLGAPL